MPQRYRPLKDKRFFTHDTRYDEVDWNDENAAIKKFKAQLEGWYIDPIESLIAASRHYGFTVIALTCVLIDTLAQYYFGEEKSSQKAFKDFLKDHVGGPFDDKLPTPVLDKSPVEDYADVIYQAFRCGILHEAHVSLYGVVADHADLVEYHPTGITRYVNESDCPTIVINPESFFREIKSAFENYFQKLNDRDPQWDNLRRNLKAKFLVSYGIDIGNETP
jgi:hypothetical protein